MFDFDYNANVPFVPIAMTMRANMEDVATSEELEETNEHVEVLSGTVSEQGKAIADNVTAIQNETEARENAVEELNEKIIDSAKLKIEVVDALPATGDTSTIYLLKVSDTSGNKYKEYVYSDGEWEEIGSVVDLSDYATEDELNDLKESVYAKTDVDTLLAPLAVKADVDDALGLKADADDVYSKADADAKFLTEHQDISSLATKDELATEMDNVYTKADADAKFLTEHQDISGLATKDELADAIDNVYTKAEADAKFLTEHQDISNLASKAELENAVAPLAVKADVDIALDEKANADAVYSKDEADAKFITEHQDITGLATKDELATAMDTVYTKAEADAKFLTEHQDISNKVDWVESTPGRKHIVLPNHDSILGTATDAQTYNLAMVSKWDVADFGSSSLHANINSKDGVVTINDTKQIATTDQIPEVSGFATKAQLEDETAAREQAITDLHEEIVALPKFKILIVDALPAVGDNATFYLLANGSQVGNEYDEYVYVNDAWEKIGTQSIDLSEYAKIAYVDNAVVELNDAIATKAAVTDLETLSGVVESHIYELESIDEKLAGLASVNAAQDARIDALVSDYKKLKEIVGELGGNVEYGVPAEGKLTDLLKKSGTVKLTEDVESSTYTGGITSKNVTTLNTNGKTITFTGATTNNPGIMTRGSEQLTIVGKGTINANGRVAIEANGANSVINLSGSTGFFGAEPTYVTDRSGGELIYCYLGTINIYAGVFKNEGENKTFMLNCYDANYANGTAKIVVMGGKFYDFNPADNSAEGEHTSFVPDGYEAVASTVVEEGVEHTVYTVKKSS